MNECEAHRGDSTLAFLRANRDGELSDRTMTTSMRIRGIVCANRFHFGINFLVKFQFGI